MSDPKIKKTIILRINLQDKTQKKLGSLFRHLLNEQFSNCYIASYTDNKILNVTFYNVVNESFSNTLFLSRDSGAGAMGQSFLFRLLLGKLYS
jgi:hypothetical protein